jgi:hypothetical protein
MGFKILAGSRRHGISRRWMIGVCCLHFEGYLGSRERPVLELEYDASVEDVYTETATATALLCYGPTTLSTF